MSRTMRPEGLDLNTNIDRPVSGHAHRASLSPSLSILSIPAISPEPAYIAPAAAANIVTSEVVTAFALPLYDDDAAHVSAGALVLINSFLDRLLFNFLSCSHSTSLASLRPAVTEVLKPKLAKEAIQSADDELQEYIGNDEDELDTFHNGNDQPHRFDLELSWKRTRLRCMVYTRLGDMEEDDEELHIQREGLEDESSRRVSRDVGIVSPAVAIFLTSILEFVGEHALMIAAHAAYNRHSVKARQEGKAIGDIRVDEIDMEKVAFNPIMGRLWRSWRKVLRSSRDGRIKPFSPMSASRRSSLATNEYHEHEEGNVPSVEEVLEEPDPSHVPLPQSEYDIDEIEVPGFSRKNTMSRGDGTRPYSTFIPVEWSNQYSDPALDSARVERRRSHSFLLQSPIDIPTDAESNADYQTPDEEAGERQTRADDEAATPRRIIPDQPQPHGMLSQVHQQVPHGSYNRRSHVSEDYDEDPAAGALQFDQGDYIIKDHERASLDTKSDAPPSARYPSNETSFLRDPHDRFSTVDAYPTERPPTSGEPAISPIVEHPSTSLDQSSLQSGDVSPIEPSDDEGDDRRTRLKPLGLNPPGHPITPPMVSPLIDPPTPRELTKQLPREITKERKEASPRTLQARQRRHDGPTRDDYNKEENREAFIVVDEPKQALPGPPSDSSSLSGKDLQSDGTIKRTRPTAPESSVAQSLGPLREIMESAHDTSDDASSATASQYQKERPQFTPRGASLPSESAPKSAVQPQKPIERRQAPPLQPPPPPGVEKAAVQRVNSFASRGSAHASPARTAESSPHGTPRSSKAKTRTPSGSTDNYRESFASRSSSNHTKSIVDDQPIVGPPGSRQQEFEQLISSGDTIQYTLTPQNMRDIESRDSQQTSPPISPQRAAANARGEWVASSQAERQAAQRRTLPTGAQAPIIPQQPIANNQTGFIIDSGPVAGRGVIRTSGPQPRDARVEKDNTKDFADFIRSTGPDGAPMRPATLAPVSTRSSRIAREQGKIRTSKGPRLQARDPIVKGGETSELIDFIRSGPPNEKPVGGHRIPRTVAPFRNTMDSEDMNPPTTRKQDTYSVTSTQDSYVARSVQSSTNSRTALLDSRSKASAAPMRGLDPDGPGPIRKRRAPRDPYAISDSEDDFDDELPTPKPQPPRPAGRDESLLDFLNSAPPPEAQTTPPPLALSKETIKEHQRRISAQNSVSSSGGQGSMRSKLGISGSTGTTRTPSREQGPPPPAKPGSEGRQAGSPMFAHIARTPNVAGGTMGRPPPARGSGPKPKARDPSGEDNSMRDLAAFLKDSQPPPGMASGGFAGNGNGMAKEEEKGGTFGRMFGRKKGKGFT